MHDTLKLDYQEAHFNINKKIDVPPGLKLTKEELKRVPFVK